MGRQYFGREGSRVGYYLFFQEGHPQRFRLFFLRLLVTDEAVSARAVGEAPAYYVFGCTDSEGFVIVAGDDAVMPVLGYSFDSSFPQTDLPVNLKLWLQESVKR